MFVFFFFPQLLSTSLKCTFEFTGMSIAQSSRESQLLRASESLYLISTSFFFFIPLNRRGTQPSVPQRPHARGSIYAAIVALVVYVASTIRHVRGLEPVQSPVRATTDRRNAILIAIYCQNQSANLRGVYNIDHATSQLIS